MNNNKHDERNKMTTQAVSKPNEQRTIKTLLEGEAFRNAVANALPSHLKPDRFIRVALTAMTRTPRLAECDQHSFFNALLTLSQLGIEPDGRRAHLIPFRNNKRGIVECQLIVDYKGLVELAMRSGTVSSIHADVVCENDAFDYDRGELKTHRIDFKKPRGPVYAAYAMVRFKDGTEKCDVMTRDEIEGVRSRSKAKNSGPWETDWNEMAKKTVFRRLSKWITLSPEYRDALDVAEPEVIPGRTALTTTAGTMLELTPEKEPATEEEPEQTYPDEDEEADAGLAPAKKAKSESLQDTLAEMVTRNGFTFDHFLVWAVDTGNAEDDMPDFSAVSDERCERFIKAKKGLLKGLEMVKAKAEGRDAA